jgi:hypothetical protein
MHFCTNFLSLPRCGQEDGRGEGGSRPGVHRDQPARPGPVLARLIAAAASRVKGRGRRGVRDEERAALPGLSRRAGGSAPAPAAAAPGGSAATPQPSRKGAGKCAGKARYSARRLRGRIGCRAVLAVKVMCL